MNTDTGKIFHKLEQGKAIISEGELERLLAARATRHLAARRLQRELSREKAARKERWKSRFVKNEREIFEDEEKYDTEDMKIAENVQSFSPVTSRESTYNITSVSVSETEENDIIASTDSFSTTETVASDSSGWRSRFHRVMQSPSSSFLGVEGMFMIRDADSSLESSPDFSEEKYRSPRLRSPRCSVPLPPSERLGSDFFVALKQAREEDSSSSSSSTMSSRISIQSISPNNGKKSSHTPPYSPTAGSGQSGFLEVATSVLRIDPKTNEFMLCCAEPATLSTPSMSSDLPMSLESSSLSTPHVPPSAESSMLHIDAMPLTSDAGIEDLMDYPSSEIGWRSRLKSLKEKSNKIEPMEQTHARII